ncbi:MAG: ABC transporter permease, partial [Sheuella sp.]|nr:ABC transporter permease [Sheuella sp.]
MLILKFLSFLAARLWKAFGVILGVVVFNFFLIRLAPGDPASIMAGEAASSDPAYVEQLRQQFGFDQPLYQQLWLYLKGILHFDLGYSYRNKLPVLDLILERLPATLLLMGCAFVFSIVIGVALGVLASRSRYTNRHKWLDSAIMTGALLLYATPLFWLSLLMIIFFSVTLGWLPAFGMESVGAHYTGWAHVADVATHLVLPVISLGCFFMAV